VTRTIVLSVASSVVLALSVAGCPSSASEEGSGNGGTATTEPGDTATAPAVARAAATRVELAIIEESEASIELVLPGEINGARDAILGSAMGGFIERVLVENGDEVRAGQVLVRVDTAMASARLAQSAVELRSAEREVGRGTRLGAALAQAQRDAYQTRFDAAEAAHASARIAVSRSVIRAPFPGVIANLEADRGEIAPPGAPLLRLIELDDVKVTISVSDRDVVTLREGMPATISTDAASGVFEGLVSHINPVADLQTRSFLVDISVANPERRLLPGMIAQVRVRAALGDAALVIPQDWVVTKLDGLGVYLEQDGQAVWRPIGLGPVVRHQVVVNEGLELGARVITTGHRELEEGDPVLVVREGRCCTDGRVRF